VQLRLKLAVLFVLIGLMPMAILGQLLHSRGERVLVDEARAQVASIGELKKDSLMHWMEGNVALLRSVAARPRVIESVEQLAGEPRDGASYRSIRDDLVRNHLAPNQSARGLEDYHVLDPTSGEILAATAEESEGEVRGSEMFFLRGSEETFVDRVVRRPGTEEPVMHVATPIRSAGGDLVGVLAAHVDFDEMERILGLTSGWHTSEDSYAVNAQGLLVTEPRSGDGSALWKAIATEATAAILRGESGIGQYDDDRGVRVIGSYQWIDSLQLGLLVEVNWKEVTEPIARLRRTSITMGLVVAVVVLGVALVFARGVTRPVRRLTAGTRELATGNLEVRVPANGRDEIGQLARSFNDMIEQLQRVTASRDELDREIKRRRGAEARLRRSMTELQRSNRELERFASIASHDLQEPLRMVASYVQLLQRRYDDRLDDDAREFIGYAVDGAKRMQRLIADLLAFSRVQTRGKPFEAVDLNTVLVHTRANLAAAIDETGAVVTSERLPTVRGDQGQLISVFQNLIGNAIKFRGDAPPRVHVSAQVLGAKWKISVGDNGIGIDPQFHDRIFVIFQRLHGRDEVEGTGIGLSLCKRIIERHGGRIWVESSPGDGTTFHFTLMHSRGDKEWVR